MVVVRVGLEFYGGVSLLSSGRVLAICAGGIRDKGSNMVNSLKAKA